MADDDWAKTTVVGRLVKTNRQETIPITIIENLLSKIAPLEKITGINRHHGPPSYNSNKDSFSFFYLYSISSTPFAQFYFIFLFQAHIFKETFAPFLPPAVQLIEVIPDKYTSLETVSSLDSFHIKFNFSFESL